VVTIDHLGIWHCPQCWRPVEKGPAIPLSKQVREAMRSMQSPDFLRERKLQEIDEKLLDAPIGRSRDSALESLLLWVEGRRRDCEASMERWRGEKAPSNFQYWQGATNTLEQVRAAIVDAINSGVEEERERRRKQVDQERLGNWTAWSKLPGLPGSMPENFVPMGTVMGRLHGPGGGDSVRGEGDGETAHDDPGGNDLEGIEVRDDGSTDPGEDHG
jgi:hypothetical protein